MCMLNTAVDMVAHFGEKALVNDSKSFHVKVLSTDDAEVREVPEDTAGLTRLLPSWAKAQLASAQGSH